MPARKERAHLHGSSNRPKDWVPSEGPAQYDQTTRASRPLATTFTVDTHVPTSTVGAGNQDFAPKLPGHDYRQPNSDPKATLKMRTLRDEQAAELQATAKDVQTLTTLQIQAEREPRQKGHKPAPRWNPKWWYEAPHHHQNPLQKEEGEAWNSMEAHKLGGEIKGKDRLMRSVRRPEDVATPTSDKPGGKHPLNFERKEYYPGRDLIDAVGEQPSNDFQIRPVHLPDFAHPPKTGADSQGRMQRMREVIKQRYAGRPGLIKVFRAVAQRQPGYIFSEDLGSVLDKMGIKVSGEECDLLLNSVDKDEKGAIAFEEFADLIYGPRVTVGGASHEPQERHVRHVTKTLVDSLVQNGAELGKAFCEIDPERQYVLSKDQFSNALGTACNHMSQQAVDFLWSSQFPGEGGDINRRHIDWRSFMSQLAHFAHEHRAPTPVCVQSRKRQYDLLQRTAAITGGMVSDVDLNRPDQDAQDEVTIVADQLVHRQTKLPHKPREVGHLTENFVEVLRIKAQRCEKAVPQRVPEKRLRELLKNRKMVHQDELIQLLNTELEEPGAQQMLDAQLPVYGMDNAPSAPSRTGNGEFMSLEGQEQQSPVATQAERGAPPDRPHGEASLGSVGPACLQIVRADVEAYVATQRTNRDHEVDVDMFIANVYRPPDEKKVIDSVNDGLNRALRGHRPPRERPAHGEQPRYENYWQARYMMDLINDGIAQVESSNGGKIKSSKVFKRLDDDGDGFVSLQDLQTACARYKIPTNSADLHALFSALDKNDEGSINIGEFTRNYEVFGGSMMDNMQKPIKAVYHEGGVEHGGPAQEKMDEMEAQSAAAQDAADARATSCPPGSGRAGTGSQRSGRSRLSSSGRSIAGVPVIYDPQVEQLTGKARVTDVIRARVEMWKPQKGDLYNTLPPTRFGMTYYPDTRHVTEASVPLSGSHMHCADRFKTTNNTHSIFAGPDHRTPHIEDSMKKNARSEFRVERIHQRQRDFTERCDAANEAARSFDEQRIARKAMTQLNYERRCNMSMC